MYHYCPFFLKLTPLVCPLRMVVGPPSGPEVDLPPLPLRLELIVEKGHGDKEDGSAPDEGPYVGVKPLITGVMPAIREITDCNDLKCDLFFIVKLSPLYKYLLFVTQDLTICMFYKVGS